MSVEGDLRTFLLGDTTISNIVGGTRIYPFFVPQNGTIPAIVYQRIVTERMYAHDGQVELAAPRIQLSCWAATPNAAWILADAVRDRLSGFAGDMSATEVGLVRVVNELHDTEDVVDAARFRVILDIELKVTEPVG